MKEIILPGELVANEPKRIPGCYVEEGKTYAATVCMKADEYVVPLKGVYVPVPGDFVVGIIKEERFNGYSLELNSPYEGQLSARETRDELKIGDIISAKVLSVNEVKEAMLVEPNRLWGGELLEIEPVKVPRVIGRNSSMMNLIRDSTGTMMFVGRNGFVYLKGTNTALAVAAVLRICKESHISGLTDRIAKMLKQKNGENNG